LHYDDIRPNAQATRRSDRRGGDTTGDVRVSAVLRGAGGISGTDASCASHSTSRPGEFVCNEVAARPRQLRIVSRHAIRAGVSASDSPLPS